MKNKLKTLLAVSLLMPTVSFALEKNETVYTNLDSTGKITNTIVVNHIVNKDIGVLEDETLLTDILNINGKETFKLENNSLKWNTNGSDIFYKGKIEKEQPIETNITYYLNDKQMSSKDMIGKSGSVKIKINFKNRLENNVLVNGRYTKLYTPFVVTLGTILDSNNTNISVTNGKVVNTGTKNVIVGLSSPGLYSSLGLSELKGLDEITITYDTKKFSIGSMYIVATPKLLENSDLEIFDKMNTLYNSVNELQTNMDKIVVGSSKVKSGSSELKSSLESAIKLISSNDSETLTEEQINSIKNSAVNLVESSYTDEKKASISNNAWQQVSLALSNSSDSNVTDIVSKSIENAINSYLAENDGENLKTYQACLQNPSAMTDTSCVELFSTINTIKKYTLMSSSEVASGVSNYVAEKVTRMVSVSTSLETAKEVASQVAGEVAKNVADEVKNTIMESVKTSLNSLFSGVSLLDNGINDLNTGINQFNKEGINTLSSYSSMLKTYSNKLEALAKLSDNYKGYSSDNSTKVLFVSMVKSSK